MDKLKNIDFTKRRQKWDEMFKNPFSSRMGLLIFGTNIILLVLSIINVLLSTIWDFVDTEKDRTHFVIVDFYINVYFLLEWTARIYCSPNRWALWKQPLFWFEGLSNLVIFVDLEFLLTDNNIWIISGWIPLFCTLRCLRLFRLYWHSLQLKLVRKALSNAKDGLQMMFVLTLILLIFLGNIMFFAEALSCELRDNVRYYISGPAVGEKCSFQTLFDAIYWSIVSVTTTGYGDMVPRTWQGKIIATLAMMTSIVIFTFPITIISAHLTEVYLTNKQFKRFHKNQIIDENMGSADKVKALIKKCETDITAISNQLLLLHKILDQVSEVVETY